MLIGAAVIVILFAFLLLKIIKGTLGFVLHGFGWIIAIALIVYWYHNDHPATAVSWNTVPALARHWG